MQFDHGYRWYYFVRKDRVVHRELRPFRPIGSTGFAVIDPMPWPWPDDVDYTITGHMGPSAWIFICLYTERILGEDITATDVNDQVFQASVARTEKAGMVEAVATVPAYADVARVGIDNWHVEPDILSVGGREETIVSWRDPVVYEDVWASGRATGVTHGWVVENLKSVFCPVFGALQNQFRANLWSAGATVVVLFSDVCHLAKYR
ncbi:S1 family peptidase [Dehalococcoidia bacterium]|nr:S1 family peptidase [Dehalococcoidia bacterium]MCL0088586.1 S1 family peptidase [Dehalococcoidia bacterium]